MQTSRAAAATAAAAGAGDKTKRRIRIVVTDNNNLASSSSSIPITHVQSQSQTQSQTQTQAQTSPSRETKRLNIEYSDADGGLIWDKDKDVLILSGRNKNDKNWENWERIREQKLEKMKNICFESYRQSKRDKLLLAKPKPKQLDPTWYTDNIYSNRSDDLDEDYVPDCLKYGSYSNRILRDIREQDEKYAEDALPMRERRGEGEGSPGYGLQRSKSCKEFQYPKSQSCCFEGNVFEAGGTGGTGSSGATATTSILKNRAGVPKSYSFSASTKTMPFDIIDYELPPASNTRREKREAYRRSMNMLYSNSLDERTLAHSCCAREQCTSAKCLLDDIYAGSRRRLDAYGAGSNRNLNLNLNLNRSLRSPDDWLFDERVEAAADHHHHHQQHQRLGRGQRLPMGAQATPAGTTVICCCATEDYCCHRQAQQRAARRPHCPGHHPAAEEEEHMHCRYDTDLEQFIRAERERLLLQDKFLDEDERYLAQSHMASPGRRYAHYTRPTRSKSLLEVQPPSLFDEDSCSDTTEIDLEDFNIDLEKYWEQLDKPPSPINMDMRRNMHSNLKVKNVNVRCYNNGQPIDMHDREHERLMIKKSLLEGMPSPPQLDSSGSSNNATGFSFFENPAGSLHHPHHHQQQHHPLQQRHHGIAAPAAPAYGGYGHKVYPTADTLPTYQYNNFYPEHTTLGSVLTQQPTAGVHHASAGGHSALSLINNIFSIYKPNKYSPENCQLNYESKPEPCKKMNVPSTRRPLGAASSNMQHGHEYLHSSMKRPLLVSADQPHFKIIPEKTGLKISPLLAYDEYGGGGGGIAGDKSHQRLTSTARPLMLPH
ncbi:hypothetical protein AWZ03_001836 [Drosophila navojoa]|uniref:Uncharacterized protein n=3 Tax=Drosophila navojoa TaxID=7232 RepID=A0A484BSH4_DRONA|nr:hypothetical protein AWZ03_001836 [Drosophila navojoa]